LLVHGIGQYTILGTTTDDSIGEALDKATGMLRIPWTDNQGPAASLEACARKYTDHNPNIGFSLPLPLKDEARPTLNFSFSGLKTALKYHLESLPAIDENQQAMLAYKFQQRTTDHLVNRLQRAMDIAKDSGCLSVVISGGVARNQYIRERLDRIIVESGLRPAFAPFEYCSDNAVMIGWAAIENILAGKEPLDPNTNAEVLPVWPLDDLKF
jgi:N6-L-threonylcarbamoyladenine synthase